MENSNPSRNRPTCRRWLPLVILVGLMAAALALGCQRQLSFETLARHYNVLKDFIALHLVSALLLYMAIYIAIVALSLPGGLLLTLSGGLLFGWRLGAFATIVAATIGATIIFIVAKTSLGAVLAECALPWLARLRDEFNRNALSYLLFLRLVPVFPFVVVNIAPALLGVPLGTYIIGTVLGIIPATVAFSVAGAGLGSVIEAQNEIYTTCVSQSVSHPEVTCNYAIDTGALLTPEMVSALVLLGLLALLPIALKKWSKRRHAAS